MDAVIQQTINGLIIGSFYALIALGYSMVFGVIKLLNFAHGDIYMTGAFVGLAVLGLVGNLLGTGWLGVVCALLASMVIVGLLGVVIERVAYRPMRNAPRLSILITALAVAMVLNGAVLALTDGRFEAFSTDLGYDGFDVGDVTVTHTQLVLVAMAVTVMAALQLFITRTMYGKAMRAVAIDAAASRLMGINVDRVISLTFFIGSALAAAGGVMGRFVLRQRELLHGLRYGPQGVHGSGHRRHRQYPPAPCWAGWCWGCWNRSGPRCPSSAPLGATCSCSGR